MAHILAYPIFRAITSDGTPLVGAKLWTYEAGTSTPQAAFTDKSEETELTNPIILDSNGEAAVWLGDGKSYKLVLMDADDVPIWTKDDVSSINDLSISTSMLKDGVLANSAAGRLKMADGYLSASEDGLAKMAAGYFQASTDALAKFANGFFANSDAARAKFAAGFLSATSAGRALMADGFFSADAEGLAKMADGFFSASAEARAKFAAGFLTKPMLPTLNEQLSASCGDFSTSSATPVDVTNLAVSITTTGRPVFVGLMAEAGVSGSNIYVTGSSGTANGEFAILRDSTTVSILRISGLASGSDPFSHAIPPGAVWAIDTPAAGSYTYKVQAVRNVGAFIGAQYVKLIAYEK